MDMKLTIDGLEKERDFYFGKLRDIELICQENECDSNPVLGKIIHILYATEVTAAPHSVCTSCGDVTAAALALISEKRTSFCFYKHN